MYNFHITFGNFRIYNFAISKYSAYTILVFIPLEFSEREDVLIELYVTSCLLFKKFSSDNIILVLLSIEIHIPMIVTCKRNSSKSGRQILKMQ